MDVAENNQLRKIRNPVPKKMYIEQILNSERKSHIMREEVLAKIIEKASKIWGADASTLNEDTEFASMNPKSAHYSQMTTFLEDEFDAEVPYMNFKRCATFGEAADYVAELLDE